jgi:hypothetical protein
MKSIWAALSLLLMVQTGLGQGYLHLTEGQSITYSFSTVPFTAGGAVFSPSGIAKFHMYGDCCGVTRLEMFEDELGQNLIGTSTNIDWSKTGPLQLQVANAWQDLNGSMRLTVLEGYGEVSGLEVNVFGGPGAAGDFNLWGGGTIIPVPEPTPFVLVGLGVGVFLYRRRFL